MEKQLINDYTLLDREGEILVQLNGEHGISLEPKYNEKYDCLSYCTIYVDGRYAGIIHCWKGKLITRKYYWSDKLDMIFVNEKEEK